MSNLIRDSLIRAHKDGVSFGAKINASRSTYADYINNRNASIERELAPILVPTLIAQAVSNQLDMLFRFIRDSYWEKLTSYRSPKELTRFIDEVMQDMGIFDESTRLASTVLSLMPNYDERIAAINIAANKPAYSRKSLGEMENHAAGFMLICSENIKESMTPYAYCKYGDLKHIPEEDRAEFARHNMSLVDVTVGLKTIYYRHYEDKYNSFDDFVYATINLPQVPSMTSKEEIAKHVYGYIKTGRKNNITNVYQLRNKGFYHDYCVVDDLEDDVPLLLRLTKDGESKFADQIIGMSSGSYYDGDILVSYKKIMGRVYVSSGMLGDVVVEPKSVSHIDRLYGVMNRDRFSLKNCTIGLKDAKEKKNKIASSEAWFGKFVDSLPSRSIENKRISIVACVVHDEDLFNTNSIEVIDQCLLFDEVDKSLLIDLFRDQLKDEVILNVISNVTTNGEIDIKLKSGISMMFNTISKIYVVGDDHGNITLTNLSQEELDKLVS